MRYTFKSLVACLLGAILVPGCSVMQDSNGSLSNVVQKLDKQYWEQRGDAEDGETSVANPPATTIRFDGQEVLLGTTDVTQIAADEFWGQLSELLDNQKFFTAQRYITKNADTAEQVLWERWATEPNSIHLRFLADTTSFNVGHSASWNAMLDAAKSTPVAAQNYQRARNAFTKALRSGVPSKGEASPLRVASQQLQCPLAMVDTLHLIALGEFVADRNVWAESLLLQAAEKAEANQDQLRAANLWLLVTINAGRTSQQSITPDVAWKKAVAHQCNVHLASNQPLNSQFWVRAERHKPTTCPWPASTKRALVAFASSVGCRFTGDASTDLVVCCAVGKAQLDDGDPQLALINFKKAETFAGDDDVMWLRIAQSECLAALGQHRAAATLLSGPLASKRPDVSAAANAALGSAKLQAGTFEQGAQLLNKAVAGSTAAQWPSRSKAQADLALAMLIIGETDQGLKSLHAAQRTFEAQGDVASLLQSLENETRLLEHEGKAVAAENVRQRIARIESLQTS